MPTHTLYGYTRRILPFRTTEDISEQEESCRLYLSEYLSGTHSWGGMFVDTVDSRSAPFLHRPAARELNSCSRPSDFIVIPDSSRSFANWEDMFHVLGNWRLKDTGVVILDLAYCSWADGAEKMLRELHVFAEADRARKAEHLHAGMEKRRAAGRVTNQHPPLGYKLIGRKDRRQIAPDPAERAVMGEIVRLRDEQKLSWYEIASRLLWARTQGRTGRELTPTSVRRRYLAEVKLREQEAQEAECSPASGS